MLQGFQMKTGNSFMQRGGSIDRSQLEKRGGQVNRPGLKQDVREGGQDKERGRQETLVPLGGEGLREETGEAREGVAARGVESGAKKEERGGAMVDLHVLPVVIIRENVPVADELKPRGSCDASAAGDVFPVGSLGVALGPGSAVEGHGSGPPPSSFVHKGVGDVAVVVEGLAGLKIPGGGHQMQNRLHAHASPPLHNLFSLPPSHPYRVSFLVLPSPLVPFCIPSTSPASPKDMGSKCIVPPWLGWEGGTGTLKVKGQETIADPALTIASRRSTWQSNELPAPLLQTWQGRLSR